VDTLQYVQILRNKIAELKQENAEIKECLHAINEEVYLAIKNSKVQYVGNVLQARIKDILHTYKKEDKMNNKTVEKNMKRIYKYNIETTSRAQKLHLPVGYEILDIQMQNAEICLWARVDIEKPSQVLPIRVYATGEDVNERSIHLKTVQEGTLVLHVFEEI